MARSKTIILCPYPVGKAPSQRFRFEQYLLANNLIDSTTIRSFYSVKGMEALYGGDILLKACYLMFFFVRRKLHVIEALFYSKVFIHRELAPMGPPIYESILSFFGKEIIYDFDDAIWLSNVSEVNRKFDFTKAYWKVKKIIKMAKLVTVGNQYLAEYALQFNTNVKVLPSSVDIDNVHVGKHLHKDKAVINIGWTGTHTTAAKYLPQIEAVIARLSKKHSLKFIVISNQHPAINLDNLEFIAWNEKTEIEDLLKMDIGLMPIGDEEWEKGKCSFKAIQYMALGIPTVLSPYGNNTEVVEDGKNGLFAISEQEWELQISKLIEDVQLRIELGEAAIFTIKDKYALSALTSTYQMLFN